MKTRLARLVFLVVVCTASTALAGARFPRPVSFNVPWAGGSLGSARNSGNTKEQLGCFVTRQPGSAFTTCYAADSTGTLHMCYSRDRAMADLAQKLKGDSLLSFMWNASGVCTMILVGSYSCYEPKQYP
jgi:hypothetical protein